MKFRLLFVLMMTCSFIYARKQRTRKPRFSVSHSVLYNRGRPNGVSVTGTWIPAKTRNSFSASGSWQHGTGFHGGLWALFGVDKQTTLGFGISKGPKGDTGGQVGVEFRFWRGGSVLPGGTDGTVKVVPVKRNKGNVSEFYKYHVRFYAGAKQGRKNKTKCEEKPEAELLLFLYFNT